MEDDATPDAIENALIHSHAALGLVERLLTFLSARNPELIAAFAESVVTTRHIPDPSRPQAIDELEEAALLLQRQLAGGVLELLRRKGDQPRH